MGFRFRKSVKIAPGVRLNFGKKSTSISLGGKGARFTINSKGKKTASFGIPGTGLYYTESVGGKKKRKEKSNMAAMNTKKVKAPKENKPKKPITKKWWFWIIVVGIVFSIFTGGNSDTADETLQQPDSSVSDVVGQDAPAESVVAEKPEDPEPVIQDTPKETEKPVEEPKVEATVVVAPVITPVPEAPVVENPIQEEPEKPVVEEQPVVQPEPEPETPPVEVDPEVAFREKLMQYNYVGSSESDKFHYPKCRWTGEINDQNLVHFDTKEEAADAGYGPCGTCKP